MKTREPDEHKEDGSGIEACASDLIDAIHSKDVKAAAAAIKSAFEILENEPEESESEPHSFDAQNELAAKE